MSYRYVFSIFLRYNFLFHFIVLFINKRFEKQLAIGITKIVKYKWYKITLILNNINNIFVMSWTSVFCQSNYNVFQIHQIQYFSHKIDKRYHI